MLKVDAIPGDEATGCTLTVGKQTWELLLRGGSYRKLFMRFNGEFVYVSGTPELRTLVGRGLVPTIVVEDIRPSESFLPVHKKKKSN